VLVWHNQQRGFLFVVVTCYTRRCKTPDRNLATEGKNDAAGMSAQSQIASLTGFLKHVFDALQNVVENARLGAQEIYMLRFWFPPAHWSCGVYGTHICRYLVIQNKISGPYHLSFLKVSSTLWTPSTIHCWRLFAFLFDGCWIIARSKGTISLLAYCNGERERAMAPQWDKCLSKLTVLLDPRERTVGASFLTHHLHGGITASGLRLPLGFYTDVSPHDRFNLGSKGYMRINLAIFP
jgi:hypothetical protein